MQFALGALTVLSIGLAIALRMAIKKANERKPATTNIIHLGLKNADITIAGLEPVTLALRPGEFQVRVDKLTEKLIHGLATKQHADVGTRAYCILDHAGMQEILSSQTF